MTNTKTITTQETNLRVTAKALWVWRYATRVSRVALVVALAVTSLVALPAHASSTFTVNLPTDVADDNAGDGLCDVAPLPDGSQCTLRAAIQQANERPGPDTINFDIPAAFCDPATGVATISPQTSLPGIQDGVTIDGYTQPGASPNTKTVGDDASLKIELDGTKVPNANGLGLQSDVDPSVIRGLVINRFGRGVAVQGHAVGNRIEGNFIGTDPTGTIDEGNQVEGVSIEDSPSQTVVGGTAPAARNVISGNGGAGVSIFNADPNRTSDGNRIQGNYVGTDESGTKDLGNTRGGVVVEEASATTVGGTTAASRNLISGNGDSGLAIVASQGTKVLGNRIGTTASGTGALGNVLDGVFVFDGSSETLIGDGTLAGSNTIAFNGEDGIGVEGSTTTGNEVSRNSVFSNGGLGVDLIGPGEGSTGSTATNVSTPNDAGDTDSGPNDLQNKPVVTSAKTSSTKTTIRGKLNSTPNKTFTLRFFSNPTAENEGKKLVGQTIVSTDGAGNATFAKALAKISVGKTVTATATSASTHDTSEFSAPRTVTSS